MIMIAGILAENTEVILYQSSPLVLFFPYCLPKSYNPAAPHYYISPMSSLYQRLFQEFLKAFLEACSFKNTASKFVERGTFFNPF